MLWLPILLVVDMALDPNGSMVYGKLTRNKSIHFPFEGNKERKG